MHGIVADPLAVEEPLVMKCYLSRCTACMLDPEYDSCDRAAPYELNKYIIILIMSVGLLYPNSQYHHHAGLVFFK